MQKFLVMYLAPALTMEEWMKKPEADRKADEQKMQSEWKVWMELNKGMFKETQAAGKTKKVTKGMVMDTKNDLMMYSIVEGESHEAVADAFKDHPHFGIPGATIEVLPIRPL